MTKITHRFRDHIINPKTEILVIGTFNPETEENIADFFYGRQRNFLWSLIPIAFNEVSLKGKSKEDKMRFIDKYKIDFIDLISEVEVEEVANYDDSYIDNKVSIWNEVKLKIEKLPDLKMVCLTRKTFSDIPNMKIKIDEIKEYCNGKNITFKALCTPARFYNSNKQTEWTEFLSHDSRQSNR